MKPFLKRPIRKLKGPRIVLTNRTLPPPFRLTAEDLNGTHFTECPTSQELSQLVFDCLAYMNSKNYKDAEPLLNLIVELSSHFAKEMVSIFQGWSHREESEIDLINKSLECRERDILELGVILLYNLVMEMQDAEIDELIQNQTHKYLCILMSRTKRIPSEQALNQTSLILIKIATSYLSAYQAIAKGGAIASLVRSLLRPITSASYAFHLSHLFIILSSSFQEFPRMASALAEAALHFILAWSSEKDIVQNMITALGQSLTDSKTIKLHSQFFKLEPIIQKILSSQESNHELISSCFLILSCIVKSTPLDALNVPALLDFVLHWLLTSSSQIQSSSAAFLSSLIQKQTNSNKTKIFIELLNLPQYVKIADSVFDEQESVSLGKEIIKQFCICFELNLSEAIGQICEKNLLFSFLKLLYSNNTLYICRIVSILPLLFSSVSLSQDHQSMLCARVEQIYDQLEDKKSLLARKCAIFLEHVSLLNLEERRTMWFPGEGQRIEL